MHNGASRANRLRASASVRTAVFYGAMLCCSVGTMSTCCVGRSPFCGSSTQRWHAVDHAVLSVDQANCRVARCMMPTVAIVTMVDPVANAGVADTLETCLADARKHHADGEYGTIPLLIVELGIRSQWASEHPSRLVSPRPVRNKDGVDDEVDGNARVSDNNGTKQRGVIKVDGGVNRSQARVQQSTAATGSSRANVDGRRRSPLQSGGGLSATSHVTAGGIALTSCRERLDAGHQAWHFILSTYQVRDDLYIAQLEEKMTHIRMGEQELATDYCNRARLILAEMRMAGAEYSTASYISHIVKGLPRGYNLMKRMMMRRKPGGGGSRGGQSTMDVDEKRSTRDKGRGGGGRWRGCWICHDPDHLSYECPDRADNNEDDTKGSRGRSTSRRPRRDAKLRKEK
ncbi:unnamed protein product [Closterium sp. NIES-54]